jgi:hypothetical protein
MGDRVSSIHRVANEPIWPGYLDAAIGCDHAKAAAQYEFGTDLRAEANNDGRQANRRREKRRLRGRLDQQRRDRSAKPMNQSKGRVDIAFDGLRHSKHQKGFNVRRRQETLNRQNGESGENACKEDALDNVENGDFGRGLARASSLRSWRLLNVLVTGEG